MYNFSYSLGDTVKKARLEKRLTQVALAEKVGIDSRTVINIENHNGNPKMEILFPLIWFLEIDPWEIFYPEIENGNLPIRQLQIILKECSDDEINSLIPICHAALSAIRSSKGIPIKQDT